MRTASVLSLVLSALCSCTRAAPSTEPRTMVQAEPRSTPVSLPEPGPQPSPRRRAQPQPSPVPPSGSYLLRNPATVRVAPDANAEALGVLAVGTRLPRTDTVDAPGCRGGWLPVEPRGFVCIGLHVSDDEPDARVQPVVPGGGRLPTVYGRVRRTARVFADAASVRANRGVPSEVSLTVERRGLTRIDGREYWRTRHGLIARTDIRRLRGSNFAGVSLDDDVQLPIAWTIPGTRRSTAVRLEPSARDRVTHRVPAFTVLPEPDATADPDFVFVPSQGWLPKPDVRVAIAAEAPADLAPDELWLDVNLDQQTLVAYRGTQAVFATLVSTGKARYETPTGEFRIQRKVAMRTMNSRPGAKESYAVDKVPWTAYFKDGYALHTAYWHAGFGRVRSHGCINLSPTDARRLYDWMGPHAAPGWREVYATKEQPGTRVRIARG